MTEEKERHTLTVIGWMGVKHAYLDVPYDEAVRRYGESEGTAPIPEMIETFTFTDEFGVYAAWGIE